MFSKSNKEYAKEKTTSTLFEQYKQNMNLCARKLGLNPTSKELINNEINNIDHTSVVSHYVDYPGHGNMDIKIDTTKNIFDDTIKKQKIITTVGAVYDTADHNEAIASTYIKEKKTLRSGIKKKMSALKAKGLFTKAKTKYFEQLSIKRGINSMSGVANRSIYFKSIVNYNAITGIARSNVMSGYVMIEKSLGANLYFEEVDDAINYIISCLQIYPGDMKILQILDKYGLRIVEDYDFEYYIDRAIIPRILSGNSNKVLQRLYKKLSPLEKTFIFYNQCFNNLFIYNSNIFIPFFKSIFKYKDETKIRPNISNESLFEVDDIDLMMMVITASYTMLDNKTPDELDSNEDYIAIKTLLLNRYYHIENKLADLEELFDIFIFTQLNIAKLFSHANMLRNTTILSDTDSNIFTTILYVYWYTKTIQITDDAISIHSLIVYLISKLIEHILALSVQRANADNKNIKIIAMKNEFFYKVLVRTVLSKHYFANIIIQEGVVIPGTEQELKGKNLLASDISDEILQEIRTLTEEILTDLTTYQKLDSDKIINKAIALETQIYQTTKKGNAKYLFTVPIKSKAEYANYYISQYFNYMLWQSVFSEKYGNLDIPVKVKTIKLAFKMSYKNISKLEYIKEIDESIYDKLVAFLNTHKKKKIELIIFPMDIKIPKEILPIINTKAAVVRNMYGIYLVLRSLGIVYMDFSKPVLLNEIYKIDK